MNTNQVKIKKLDNQGRGIAYYDEQIMFIPNALPEEIINIKEINFKKKYYEAEVDEIIEQSNERIVSKCPYYKTCGGCNIMHMNYNLQREFKINKELEILKKYADIKTEIKFVENDKQLFYRNKITLKIKNYKWGYYNSKSHDLIGIENCLLATSTINEIINSHEFLSIKNGEITIRSNIENEILIAIKSEELVEINFDSIPDNVCGIVVNNETKHKDNYFYDYIGSYKFKVSYNSFFQVNNYIATRIFDILEGNLFGENLLDLYCGVGTLGTSVSKNFKNIYGIEIIDNAVSDAKHNANVNNITNATYYCGSTEKILNDLKVKFDTIIVDPPRSGLNKETIDLMLYIKPKRIAYISCDPFTFARDLKVLKEEYNIKKINILEMFPNTYHIESICILERE